MSTSSALPQSHANLWVLKDPTSLCEAVVKSLAQKLNGSIRVGLELEFYLRDARGEIVRNSDQIFSLVSEQLGAIGIKDAQISSEIGDGQYELALQHQDNPLKQCVNLLTGRDVISRVALEHGAFATFAAQPFDSLPGCSLQVSVSLHSAGGLNVLTSGVANCGDSTLIRNALGGLLHCMSSSMIAFAPTTGSYRRLKVNFATGQYRFCNAPRIACWGVENRTAAIRVARADSPSMGFRLEHRVPSADSNPYLTLAFVLGGIAFGIENDVPLNEPECIGISDHGSSVGVPLPRSYEQAIEQFVSSDLDQYLGQIILATGK